jgi:Tfp pilus assembly protein PilP
MKGEQPMARQAYKNRPITPAQVKRIHTIVGILKIDDDTYRAALDSRFNVTTCKDLNLSQAQTFLQELEALAIKNYHQLPEPQKAEKQPERYSNLDNRPGMATPAQLRKIESMWQGVSIIPDQDARNRALRSFVLRIAKVADLRFLDRDGASKVINALNVMEKRSGDSSKGAIQ